MINIDNYGMDLNSDDNTDDETHPQKPQAPSSTKPLSTSTTILWTSPCSLGLFSHWTWRTYSRRATPTTTSALALLFETYHPCRVPWSLAAWSIAWRSTEECTLSSWQSQGPSVSVCPSLRMLTPSCLLCHWWILGQVDSNVLWALGVYAAGGRRP
jgi:hypothetical protein